MDNIIDLLTTDECIIIYIITGILCLISFLIYTFDSTKDRRRKKQNTKELNKLVEEVEEYDTYEDYDYSEEPKLETIETVTYDKKDEFIEKIAPNHEEANSNYLNIETTKENTLLEEMVNETITKDEEIEEVEESTKMDSQIMLEVQEEADEEFIEEEIEELQYTSIEPNKEEAKKTLEELPEKLKQDELKKEEFFKQETKQENIDLTKYEQEQEENAIISLEELNKKSKEIYESNEINQYKDEGNEPISLKDLEERMNKQLKTISENFEINRVAEKPTEEEISEMLDGSIPVPVKPKETKTVKMDDFKTIKTSKYRPTPVISPIFGIEKNYKTDLELENTANYEKLDEEIKKTNEFMMTLKELQQQQNN